MPEKLTEAIGEGQIHEEMGLRMVVSTWVLVWSYGRAVSASDHGVKLSVLKHFKLERVLYIGQTVFKLMVLPQPSEYWDYRFVSPQSI